MHSALHLECFLALLVIGGSVMACASSGPQLRQPVGTTTLRSQDFPPPPPLPKVEPEAPPPKPCGMDRLPSIDFAYGSSDLEPSQETTLAELARCLTAESPDAEQLVLVGHADPIGTSTYNLDLAYDRAVRVKNRLIALGVRGERIVVTSAGESTLPPERWGEARRVDLLLSRPEEKAPEARP